MPTKEEKLAFYKNNVKDHKRKVAKYIKKLMRKLATSAMEHDDSKLSQAESPYYIDPVWDLNHEPKPKYGSDEHKALTDKMGNGWKHHLKVNRHHPEHHENGLRGMNLVDLIEMVCDWCAAAERGNNDPALALDQVKNKKGISPDLEAVIRNTLRLAKGEEEEEPKKKGSKDKK